MAIVRPLKDVIPGAAFLFLVFMFLTTYGVLNVVVGIICEQTLAISKDNDDLAKRRQNERERKVLDDLREIFVSADTDASGNLNRQEFCRLFDAREERGKVAREKFTSLGVPVDNPEDIFTLFDQTGDGEIDLTEFFNGVFKVRGNASGKDLMKIRGLIRVVSRRTGVLEERVNELHTLLSDLNATPISVPAARFEGRVIGSFVPLTFVVSRGPP